MATSMQSTNPNGDDQLRALTFVMTVEYNGFQYAGFQRQSATPRINPGNGATATSAAACGTAETAPTVPPSNDGSSQSQNGKYASKKRDECHTAQQSTSTSASSSQRHPTKKAKTKKTTPTPVTVQQRIETALRNWTNLSVATLRVRGAGRTDKGVHASGQVVAFDVPLTSLTEGLDSSEGGGAVGNINDTGNDGFGEALSEQSAPLLREALRALTDHKSKTRNNDDDDESIDAKPWVADRWQIRRAIATRLPEDIVVRSVRVWTGPRPFETRKGISRKTYVYRLRFRRRRSYEESCRAGEPSSSVAAEGRKTAQQQKSDGDSNGMERSQLHPICNAGPHILRRIDDRNSVWLCPWPLDPNSLRRACDAFVGRHDFFNFVHKEERRKATRLAETSIDEKPPHEIDLFEFEVDARPEEEEDRLAETPLPPVIDATFRLQAKGFHRSMVRNLVGFAVDVARGVRDVDDIPVLLMEKKAQECCTTDDDPRSASLASMVNSAPACGLSLSKVEYEHDNFL